MAIHHTTTFTIMDTLSHNNKPSSSSHHHQSLFSNNPLFSSIVTLYILILLYFPQIFLKTVISPLLISTLILLLSLLRLGASQQLKQQSAPLPPPPPTSLINYCEGATIASSHQTQTENQLSTKCWLEHESKPKHDSESEPKPKPEPNMVHLVLKQENVKATQCNRAKAQLELESGPIRDQDQSTKQNLCWAEPEPKPPCRSKLLLEWDVGAPLEVIYEAYEGEEGGEAQNDEFWKNAACCNNKAGKVVEKYPSLSRYYPETDSDSDSEDDEEEREGLIEIALDYGFGDKRIINVMMKVAEKKEKEEFYFDDHDEDNLIEIDISSTKNMYDFAW